MSIIYIETNLIGQGEYEFIQTWVEGSINVDEHILTENHDDRMYAAMTNLGYACKWFADKNIMRGDVCITTDTDGRDQKHSGEHDDLYKAIRSQKDYSDNRAKYALIYGRYVGYLDRIRELANTYEIGFTQNETAVVIERPKELELDRDNPYLIHNQNWTRQNIIQIKLSGNRTIVKCKACQASIEVEQTDKFVPIRLTDKKGYTVLIKSNKHLVRNFQEIHLGQHLNYEKAKN